MNYIYNYCIFYLGSKATYNFFLKAIFRPIRKVYKEKEIRHWILTIRTAIYRTFIPSLKHPPIYIKEGIILERCLESFCLKHYFEKVKEWHRNRNKDNETTII